MFYRCVARLRGYELTAWLMAVMSTSGWAQSGQLQNFSITPKKNTVGASSIYIISFTASSGLNRNDKILLYFPCDVGFDISTALYAANVMNLNGGFEVTRDFDNCLIGIERDGHGVDLPPNGACAFSLSVFGNPRRPGQYEFNMNTQANDGRLLDVGRAYVTIAPDTLSKFQLSAILSPKQAGVAFPITITAQDAFDNTITSFNGPVNLSSPNGVVLPNSVTLTNGKFTGNVVYQTPGNNKTITVNDGKGHVGGSISFNVVVGPLDHILLRHSQGGEFGNFTMTADDSVTVLAAGYDAANNYLGEIPVNWSQTGNLVLFPNPSLSASFRFSPQVGSPTTIGKIIGRTAAPNVRGDTTGTITVNPGKPFGKIQLTATPRALPADGAATAQVTATAIKDADGNYVGANRSFGVSIPNAVAGSAPATVRTDSTSALRFTFTAGTAGGAATIFVASDEGLASGSVNISVNQLRILAVETALSTVSQGQTDIPVTMLVQNIGVDTVRVDSAKLVFSQAAGFAAVPLFSRPPIPGNGVTQTLRFSVRVNMAAPQGVASIDGQIFGRLPGGASINDLGADAPAMWSVQSRPQLSYVHTLPGLLPKQVIPGGLYQFQVPINNAGAATLELKPDSTTFMFYDAMGDSFVVKLDANNGTQLPGNKVTALTFRRALIPNSILRATYAPALRFIGTHNGVRLDTLLTLPAELVVGQIPPLQIVDVLSSQGVVTQNMTKKWTITLLVKNNTTAVLNLRDTELSFVKLGVGGRTDLSFQIIKPVVFKNANSTGLAPASQDSLEFQIVKTGQSAGTLAVFAKVFVNELIEPAESEGNQKNIVVQTPAKPQVMLRVSQPAVTQNQRQPWQVFMQVKNPGESAAQIIFDETAPARSTRLSLLEAPGYVVAPNTTNITLGGEDSTEIIFNVLQTGPDAGRRFIDGQVYVQESNSGDFYFASSDAASRTSIAVQTAAVVTIDSTVLAGARDDTVSAGQKFQIRVRLKKTGEEPVDTVRVRLLQMNGNNSLIARNVITLSNPLQPAIFDLTAGAAATDTFLARLEAVHSLNTRAYTGIVGNPAPQADEAAVTIQNPARLSILEVKTSESVVRAGRTQPWLIFVLIQNPGAAPLWLEPASLIFKIGEVEQKEYTLADSTRNAGIVLAGGAQQMLIYKVTKTGTSGGVVKIAVTAYGRDRNSKAPLAAEYRTTTFTVETTALIKIVKTSFPAAVNRVPDTDIALVNTAQNFSIEVTIENNGQEIVDTAYVSLVTSGNSSIQNPQAKAVRIGTLNQTGTAFFSVRADRQPESPVEETFIARLDSAVTELKARAGLTAALDSVAVVRIEAPAKLLLELKTDDDDQTLTIGQEFEVRAHVINLGRALTDKSGLLQIRLPEGYHLVGPDPPTKNFAADDFITWRVQAPFTESVRDTLAVSIQMPPLDKNSGGRAAVVDTVMIVVVNTLATQFKIDSTFVLEPAGARDRILSTEQLFTIAAHVTASPNLSNKTATLTLPPDFDYRLAGPNERTTKEVPSNNVVQWQVQAPSATHSGAAKFLLEVSGFDGQKTETRHDTLVIKNAQARPFLELVPRLQESGVSINQLFTIAVDLRKGGEAFVKDTAEVAIDIASARLSLVESPGKTTDKKFVIFQDNEYSRTLTWLVQAFSQPTPAGQRENIVFRLTKKPRDVNSDKEVQTANDPAFYNLRIVDRGIVGVANLQIISPPGARDQVLSTDQDFVISDSVYWKDATNVSAQLLLPPGFVYITDPVQNLSAPGSSGFAKPFWHVQVLEQKVTNAELKVLVTAKDARNDTSALTLVSNALRVSVVERANPRLSARISSPANALDYKVSVGQPFEVTVEIQHMNAGEAAFSGAATVSVDFGESGYTLANSQETRSKTSDQFTFTWRIRARPDFSEEPQSIIFRLDTAPRDTNTNKVALSTLSQVMLTVRTEAKKLLVEPIGESGGPAVRGQKELPLLRLKLNNPGEPGSSKVAVRKFSFKLYDREHREVSPSTALAGIRVVNANWRQRVYGALATISTNNPLEIPCNESIVLAPAQSDTILIWGEIAEMATARNFSLVFDHAQNFEVTDLDSGTAVVVENEKGQSGEKFKLVSQLIVLFGAAPSEAFFNYPNPFQPGNDRAAKEGTHFNYNLPTATAGQLKIYTLLGELVWETSFSAADPAGQAGNHARDIFWNGYNGAGRRVLNGVYIAVLRLPQYGTFTTKVAVLRK